MRLQYIYIKDKTSREWDVLEGGEIGNHNKEISRARKACMMKS